MQNSINAAKNCTENGIPDLCVHKIYLKGKGWEYVKSHLVSNWFHRPSSIDETIQNKKKIHATNAFGDPKVWPCLLNKHYSRDGKGTIIFKLSNFRRKLGNSPMWKAMNCHALRKTCLLYSSTKILKSVINYPHGNKDKWGKLQVFPWHNQ